MANPTLQAQEHTSLDLPAPLSRNGGTSLLYFHIKKSTRFGTADRDGLYGNSAAPGPGTYGHQTQFGSPGKGVSMTPKRPVSSPNRAPGPGSYEFSLADKSKGPSYGY